MPGNEALGLRIGRRASAEGTGTVLANQVDGRRRDGSHCRQRRRGGWNPQGRHCSRRRHAAGRRHQVVGLLYPGELVGLPILGQSAFAYECATEVEICVFERSRFDKIVRQTPEMLQELYMSALADGNMMRERMMLCASQSTLERIATYLLMMLDRREVQMERLNLISQKKVAVSAISRRDLASYLGTTIESISRNIHTLASRGIVRIIDSSHFEVLDRPALLSLSGVAEDDLSLLRHGPKARVPASASVSPTSSTAVAPV